MSKRIESQKVTINCPAEKVFDFLSNFDNFEKFLPEQVTNWHSEGVSCSFEVKGLTTLGLRITDKISCSKISMKGEGLIPFDFTLDANIVEINQTKCEVQMVINAKMNPFIAMVAEKPLNNFIDELVVKLKEVMEKQ